MSCIWESLVSAGIWSYIFYLNTSAWPNVSIKIQGESLCCVQHGGDPKFFQKFKQELEDKTEAFEMTDLE